MVKWGYAKPYMFYNPDTEEYANQLNSFSGGNETIKERLLKNLGDLYDPKYANRYFLWKYKFGPEDAQNREDYWLNFSFLLKMLCFCTLIFEFL